jgi:hypothetical protein
MGQDTLGKPHNIFLPLLANEVNTYRTTFYLNLPSPFSPDGGFALAHGFGGCKLRA